MPSPPQSPPMMDAEFGGDSLQREVDLQLSFFKKRLEVEADYAEALTKLSKKQDEAERKLDDEDRSFKATWRSAWMEVRRSVDMEAHAHSELADRLGFLIATLTTFREDKVGLLRGAPSGALADLPWLSQDRMRRGIKAELRKRTMEHAEAKASVAKLRKTYERKVEEVQLHEEQESKELAVRGEAWPPEHWEGSDGGGPATSSTVAKVSRRDRSSSSVSAASSRGDGEGYLSGGEPVFVSGATSLGTNGSSAYRDPLPAKAPNVFDVIAKRDWVSGRQSIARAVGNLGKSEKGRQTSSRLRREAEQADREYRAGIFSLDTLRIKRDRVNFSARTSMLDFASELSATLQAVLTQYGKNLVVAGQKRVAIAQHSQPEIDKIDPSKDVTLFAQRLEDPMLTDRTFYINAFVGECRSLLFGVSLSDYRPSSQDPDELVPIVVQKCIAGVDDIGLTVEGIYRISAKFATVQKVAHQIEKDEFSFQFEPSVSPPTIAAVLKLYLRQLPNPLFPFSTADRHTFLSQFEEIPPAEHLASLTKRIRRLPAVNQATLKALCEHLSRVVEKSEVNKMTVSNLSLVFTPVVFGEDDVTLEQAKNIAKDRVMEILISYQETIFEGLPVEPLATTRPRPASGLMVVNPDPEPTQDQDQDEETESYLAPNSAPTLDKISPTSDFALDVLAEPHRAASITPTPTSNVTPIPTIVSTPPRTVTPSTSPPQVTPDQNAGPAVSPPTSAGLERIDTSGSANSFIPLPLGNDLMVAPHVEGTEIVRSREEVEDGRTQKTTEV